MHEVAKLEGYRISQDGTELKILIPNRNLEEFILAKGVRSCGISLDDGRKITAKQRMKAYATIGDIASWTGYLPEEAKEILKYLHISRTGCEYFSLGDCSVDTARDFITTLIDFCLEHGVILSDLAINRTDDIGKYLYACLKYRKCCICGKPNSDLHHVDAIGRGRDRTKVDDSNLKKMCLCRTHHTEFHQIGRERFEDKYKVYGILFNQRAIENENA